MEESRTGTWGVGVGVGVGTDQHDKQDSSCECHINKAEIQKGEWEENKNVCIANCKTQFLQSITPGWSEAQGWADVCGNLNLTSKDVGVAEYRFWSLYWCDSKFCGVAIEQGSRLGQDPNVDSIITTCDNNGFRPIVDPGPPPEDYKCSIEGDGGSCTDSSFTRLQLTSSSIWETSTVSTAVSTTSVGTQLGTVSTTQGTTSVLQQSDFSHPSPVPLAYTLWQPVSQEGTIPPPLIVSPTAADIFTIAAETTPSLTTPASKTTKLPPVVGMQSSFPTLSSSLISSPAPSLSATLSTLSTLILMSSTSSTSSLTAPAAAETSTSSEAASSSTSGGGLSGGAKIAIAVCTTIALLFLICAILICLRKRKRRGKSPHRNLRSRLGLTRKHWGGNPTPLISPASSLMGTTANNQGITPPLRLRERKFIPSLLPSVFRPGGSLNRSGSPPLTPLTPQHSAGVFPSSPICTPTTSKLVPRHERKPGGYTGGLPPIPAPPPSILFTNDSRGSAASSATAATNNHFLSFHNDFPPPVKPVTQSSSPFGGTPPGSPTRPPRPHDSPLEIPDLITAMNAAAPTASTNSLVSPPLSPPPNRALPAPPSSRSHPYSFISNSSSSNYSSPAGSTNDRNSAAALPPGRGTGTATLYHHGRSSVMTAAGGKRSVSNDVERGSWGSWSGTTAQQGGMIGKAIGSVRDKERGGGGSLPFVNGGGSEKGKEEEEEEVSPRSSGSSATVTGGTLRTLRVGNGGGNGGGSEVSSLGEGRGEGRLI
ncbi:hypothetical protein QBC40DRAFT_329061 [Triangularia verruculosa]|uniref:Uncharacterized protein n=1 Tax=Triangularia verruculosa TaxID=2587418 RepID=A0AAN6XQI0_9PEZI|nr:hypothetical protein QBC40DRAFT_329061 [Triangularia verruculosa]